MSTLAKETDLKGLQGQSSNNDQYVWPVKSDLKNAIYAYKAYINNGSTEKVFDQAVNKLLYAHFKKNHEISSTEEVLISEDDLKQLGLTSQEFKICMQTIGNILTALVKIDVNHANNEQRPECVFNIILSLIK
ncbi:MAG: hypothetical protein JWL92_400 [Candidatus Nomurabacteria bacterium]|nr:hypothetical protein [Candidatus Nomurabacteria bacterium]